MDNQLSAKKAGRAFRKRIGNGKILPIVGIYDVFSAKIAAERFEGIFCSGFSYAASSYGLPDIGYVNWRDMTDFSTKIRHVIHDTHILVDIDDGYGDEMIAASVVRNLESNGLSAVIMEDQKRPRKCGHFQDKKVLPIEEYLTKLEKVLDAKKSIFIIARTDSTDYNDGLERAIAYSDAGADGVMVEAIHELSIVKELSKKIKCPIIVNQLLGGKSPNWDLNEMEDSGVSIVIYSTPCLFTAQYAMENYLESLLENKKLPSENTVTMGECNKILYKHF